MKNKKFYISSKYAKFSNLGPLCILQKNWMKNNVQIDFMDFFYWYKSLVPEHGDEVCFVQDQHA
jgi:hypothetical protein